MAHHSKCRMSHNLANMYPKSRFRVHVRVDMYPISRFRVHVEAKKQSISVHFVAKDGVCPLSNNGCIYSFF
jgi:hypothetical protein